MQNTTNKWLFVITNKDNYPKLCLKSPQEIISFCENDPNFASDKTHFKTLVNTNHDDYTVKSHTQYGHFIKRIMNDNNDTDIDNAYNTMSQMRIKSMLQVFKQHNTLLVNRKGGFRFLYDDEQILQFNYQNDLTFPIYNSNDIKIEKFPDGHHYYAYLGNMQIRDKDILKWNTYEEAYEQALKYTKDSDTL